MLLSPALGCLSPAAVAGRGQDHLSPGALVLGRSLGEQPGLTPRVSLWERGEANVAKHEPRGTWGTTGQGQAGQPFIPAQALLRPPFPPRRRLLWIPGPGARPQGGGGRLGREGTGSLRCLAALGGGSSLFVQPSRPSACCVKPEDLAGFAGERTSSNTTL